MEFSEFRLTLIEKPHKCKHTRSSWLRGKEKGNTDRYWKEQFLHAWERTLHDLADDAGLNTARVAAGACAGASRAARGRRPQCCHLQGLRGAARSSPRSQGLSRRRTYSLRTSRNALRALTGFQCFCL